VIRRNAEPVTWFRTLEPEVRLRRLRVRLTSVAPNVIKSIITKQRTFFCVQRTARRQITFKSHFEIVWRWLIDAHEWTSVEERAGFRWERSGVALHASSSALLSSARVCSNDLSVNRSEIVFRRDAHRVCPYVSTSRASLGVICFHERARTHGTPR
jgi:hypothetical protein